MWLIMTNKIYLAKIIKKTLDICHFAHREKEIRFYCRCFCKAWSIAKWCLCRYGSSLRIDFVFRLNCSADRDFTACNQFFKYLYQIGRHCISGCRMSYQRGKPVILTLVGNAGYVLSRSRKRGDAFSNSFNRGTKPVEIPFRLEFDHTAAIGTTISLKGYWKFFTIKESIHKPVPP